MKRPADHWHYETLSDSVIGALDDASTDYEDKLCQLARSSEPEYPKETPEYLAKMIGWWITERDENSDFRTPICEDTEGVEGKKLAYGYVGVQAFKMANKAFETDS